MPLLPKELLMSHLLLLQPDSCFLMTLFTHSTENGSGAHRHLFCGRLPLRIRTATSLCQNGCCFILVCIPTHHTEDRHYLVH